MSYGYVYVGQIALGANPAQALKAEGKNPKAKSMCTIKKFSEFLLVKNSLANEVCEHS